MNFILIDGSYYCFYRYYAILNWFKFAHKEIELSVPIENDEFVDKFKKTFVSKIKEIPKKLKIDNPTIYVGKDCSRKDIWRNTHDKNYKATRVYDDSFMGGPFFKLAYDELFESSGIPDKHILYLDTLEADDCIAIMAKKLIEKDPNNTVTVITSDTDYLQLIQPGIKLYSLKLKPVRTEKNSTGCAEQDLFYKIILGDKSDNISKVFKKCGKKTVEKFWNDKTLLEAQFDKEPGSKDKFNHNKKLIDFNMIPMNLQEAFIEEYKNLII